MFRRFLCIVIFAVLSQAINPDDLAKMKEKMMQVAEVCAKETGAGQSDLQPLMDKLAPTTKEGKCFLFCMHKTIGFQDESGKMNPAVIFDWADSLVALDADYAKKMKEVARRCVDSLDDSGDKCDFASDMYVCYTKGCKELGIDMP